MSTPGSDAVFAGSIPELYDTQLVPLIFEPYAADLARRIAALAPSRVLETAAGTGVVTRALARALPASTELVATDLNQPMLDHAAAIGTARPVTWQKADAMQLPFGDATFDVVACQFGAMFFPDKAHGLRRGASGAAPRRDVRLQRLGPDRGERDRRHRDRCAGRRVSGRPAAFHGAHAARLFRSAGDRDGPSQRRLHRHAAHRYRRGAQPCGVAARARHSPTARVRRCATRSRPGPGPRSPKRPRRAKPRSRAGSAADRSTARSRRTWSWSSADAAARSASSGTHRASIPAVIVLFSTAASRPCAGQRVLSRRARRLLRNAGTRRVRGRGAAGARSRGPHAR